MNDLTDLQVAILSVLWEEGEATVNGVRERLAEERDLARTTVATLLSRLEDRGVVAHRERGREFVYRARVSEREVQRERVESLARDLFSGDVAALVSQLLDVEGLDRSDLERVRELIEAREAELE